MKFYNRKSNNLNDKIFEVSKVDRDASGEIIKIYGTLIRDDKEEKLEEEGTKLDARNFNLFLNQYHIEEEVLEMIQNNSTNNSVKFRIYTSEAMDIEILTTEYNNYFGYNVIYGTDNVTNVTDDYVELEVTEKNGLKTMSFTQNQLFTLNCRLKIRGTTTYVDDITLTLEYVPQSVSVDD